MMAQKYLHELLKQDQEPFLLNKYISDKRNQIKKTTPFSNTILQQHRKPIQNSNFHINLCKNTSCFFSFPETPEFRKSPLFELTSPANKTPSSRTATLLLEAALRIHKHSSSSKTKTKGFGLFGSLFKRLTQRNQSRKRQIEGENVSVKDILKWDSSKNFDYEKKNNNMVNDSEVGFVWSDDKSLEMETSCSGYSFVTDQEACGCYHCAFSESPFRFVLQTTSCSGSHTPELASPPRHKTEDKESNGAEDLNKLKSGEEEEEDKEQCSPVCVLDPPFEDDDEGHINDDDEDEDGGDFDLERSYAIVQRARQQILYKLRRFEKLAELDPIELEKRMLDQEEEEDEAYMEEDEDEEMEVSSCKEKDFKELVFEAVYLSMVHERQQIPQELKKLIYDVVVEEEREFNNSLENMEMVIKKICKRLESWKEVEPNTIDMMIEEDFFIEDEGWKKNVEQVRNMAGEVEFAIFSILVEEFSEELVCSCVQVLKLSMNG